MLLDAVVPCLLQILYCTFFFHLVALLSACILISLLPNSCFVWGGFCFDSGFGFGQYSFKLNLMLYSISRAVIIEAPSASVCVSRFSIVDAAIAVVHREEKYMLRGSN